MRIISPEFAAQGCLMGLNHPMKFQPAYQRRNSIRLRDYTYSLPGAYFVTICTQRRQCLFGEINDEEMRLTEFGNIVHDCWNNLPGHYQHVETDAFVVMPNHIHGIIVIVGAGLAPPSMDTTNNQGAASSAPTLGDIVRAFKSISTISVNRPLSRTGQPLWQRNYYDRVIRNEAELERVRQYIIENPLKWGMDPENPAARAAEISEPWQV